MLKLPEIVINDVQTHTLSGTLSQSRKQTRAEKCYTNMDSISKLRDNTIKPMAKTTSATDNIFNDMPNVFSITDDILVVGYENDGRDHDETVQKVLQRYRKVNLKLNKDSVISGAHLSHSLER